MPTNDRWRLEHILDAAREALELARGQSRDSLDTDRKLALALCHLLVVIGEAARTVSEEERALHAQVPWRQMAGLRDNVVHRYFELNLDIIWQTVIDDLPRLISALEDLLPPREEELACPLGRG